MDLAKHNNQEYEYKVISINDRIGGGADIAMIEETIKVYASEGWRVITVFTNELGKNALSIGNVGINATADQSIIIFERAVKRQDNFIHRANVDIQSSNILTPFIPKNISLFETNGSLYATLKVFCTPGFILKGLQGDLIVSNLFNDSVTLDDICFFSFTKNHDGYYESTPFPVSLPDKINYGISSAGLSIKRYIGNEGLIIVDNTEAQSIAEAQIINTPGFNKDVFFMEVNGAQNASEIYQYVCQVFENTPGVFTDELLHELKKHVEIERFYGNSKNTALKTLEKYLDAFFSSNEEATASTRRRRNQ